jgi:hypothetical protein
MNRIVYRYRGNVFLFRNYLLLSLLLGPISVALFISNFYCILISGYVENDESKTFTAIYMTISVSCDYYLSLPVPVPCILNPALNKVSRMTEYFLYCCENE